MWILGGGGVGGDGSLGCSVAAAQSNNTSCLIGDSYEGDRGGHNELNKT